MEEIFGISMDVLMYVFLGAFLITISVVMVLAMRNRIILKLGLRNIPRRRGQTVLIIIGVMLSTVIGPFLTLNSTLTPEPALPW